jgi:cytosine/adenosine deaminase-related metal-dependent hydrolase
VKPHPRTRAGWVNAHTHLYSGLAALGMPEPRPRPSSFLEILERVWWRLDRALDERSLHAAASYAAAGALLAGTTTLVDHHESPSFIEGSLDVLADVCEGLGIRALLCYGATERNGGAAEARRGLAECRRFVLSNRRPLVRGAIGLHASFTVSDETIRAAGELCRDLGVPLHVHVAEAEADVLDAQRRGWAGPLERLDALGALVPGSILAHGVHLDAAQVRRSLDAGAWLVQNPRSNHANGVGYPRALGASSRVALGTDGYPSRREDELEALLELAAKHDEPEDVAVPRADAGTRLAAEIFGHEVELDSIQSSAEGVLCVEVGGRCVVRDGKLLSADLHRLCSQAGTEASRLWHGMARL